VNITKGGKKLVRNVKKIELGPKLPAPVSDGAPALVQRLCELSEDCKRFVRCDGAWLEGVVATSWGAEDGLKTRPPPGAFAFELPQLCVTAKGKVSDILPDSLQVDDDDATSASSSRIHPRMDPTQTRTLHLPTLHLPTIHLPTVPPTSTATRTASSLTSWTWRSPPRREPPS
jgi:hypothetical protein